MFATIALGLALPYLLLSWNPAWLKFLPKPGAWMERFKVAMGFPMLATAIWLFTLTQVFYGKRIWWLGVFLVVVALAAWIYGEFVQRGRKRRTAAVLITLFLLAGGFAYAVEHKLDWRNPVTETDLSTWSPEAVAKARGEGHPVVVDFTADWCVTCNTIVKPALESARVQAKLKEVNGVLLIADNTKFPPAIATELEKYGRAGVPMVLVFPKDISKPAIVIPESGFPGTVADNVIKALEDGSK
jgi:thiol:disulfide interchange protein DsbD